MWTLPGKPAPKNSDTEKFDCVISLFLLENSLKVSVWLFASQRKCLKWHFDNALRPRKGLLWLDFWKSGFVGTQPGHQLPLECVVSRPPCCQVVVTSFPTHEVGTVDYLSLQRRHLLQLVSEADIASLDPKVQGSPLQRGGHLVCACNLEFQARGRKGPSQCVWWSRNSCGCRCGSSVCVLSGLGQPFHDTARVLPVWRVTHPLAGVGTSFPPL